VISYARRRREICSPLRDEASLIFPCATCKRKDGGSGTLKLPDTISRVADNVCVPSDTGSPKGIAWSDSHSSSSFKLSSRLPKESSLSFLKMPEQLAFASWLSLSTDATEWSNAIISHKGPREGLRTMCRIDGCFA
jgi:hypothetical protein